MILDTDSFNDWELLKNADKLNFRVSFDRRVIWIRDRKDFLAVILYKSKNIYNFQNIPVLFRSWLKIQYYYESKTIFIIIGLLFEMLTVLIALINLNSIISKFLIYISPIIIFISVMHFILKIKRDSEEFNIKN